MKNLIKLLSLLLALTLCLTACGGKEGGGTNGGDENEASENGNTENTESNESTENSENTENNNENSETAEKNYFEQYLSGVGRYYDDRYSSFAKVKIDRIFDGVYKEFFGDHYSEFIMIEVTVIEDYYKKLDAGAKKRLVISCGTFDENGEAYGVHYNTNVSSEAVHELLKSHEYFLFYFYPRKEISDIGEPIYNGDTFYFDYDIEYVSDGTIIPPYTGVIDVERYNALPLTDDAIDLNSINAFYMSQTRLYEHMSKSYNIKGFEETFGHGTPIDEAAEKIRELYDFNVNVLPTLPSSGFECGTS